MNLIGKGIYSVSLASKLTSIPASKIRRWMIGYRSSEHSNYRPPLFRPELMDDSGLRSLSFLDLVEVIFIEAFRRHGFSLQQIRLAAQRAAKLLDSDHPFALKKLYTDGFDIFIRILEADEEDRADLIDLKKQQFQFDQIVLPHLQECIDFNEFDMAERWWPAGRSAGIVVDPRISFGKPVVEGYGVPTELLSRMVQRGRSLDEVSHWYDLPVDIVKRAIKYETPAA